MIVKELYMDCFRYEESSLAHYIYHLLAEKKISLEDNFSIKDLDRADHQKVKELIQNNVLGFHKVSIFSLKMNQKDFVFIFAANDREAIQFYTNTFHQNPLNCHEYSLDYQLDRGNGVIAFRDMRKEFKSFPAIAGFCERER
ncbi:hypothetical protein COJ96_04360 [Bacillus sp. AFS073361]|uniref:hypothetical protein n=1 Tax=Bacillus sp. AFS073361 TaxID=2033511 RepID=UPI000BFA452F|nr:hypothetical protein [Bacillus sp. AFS073361]PFP30644.1 hypothetical protein COJ96_04360 [Bacillus sp. AFS073361]